MSKMRHGVETVVEEGAEAVRTCKAHQKKLYILSNYPEAHFMRNMKEYDFFSLFDGYVVSAMEHALKPDRISEKNAAPTML